jgi:hypothetical protein
MTDPNDPVSPRRVLTMQIIVGALMTGVLAFLVIVLGMTLGQELPARGSLPVVSLVSVAMLAVNALLSWVLPDVMTNRAVRQIAAGTWAPPPNLAPSLYATDAAKLLVVRQTTLLIAAALLESVGFLGCIAYLLEQQPFALAVVAASLVAPAALFPTVGRVRAWVERRLDQIAELRLRGDGASLT